MSAPLKADVTAADRLLKAAVRRAVADFRSPGPFTHEAVVETLTTAALGAELLLSERAR